MIFSWCSIINFLHCPLHYIYTSSLNSLPTSHPPLSFPLHLQNPIFLLSLPKAHHPNSTSIALTEEREPKPWCSSAFSSTRSERWGAASQQPESARGAAAEPASQTWRQPRGSATYPSTGKNGRPSSVLSAAPLFDLIGSCLWRTQEYHLFWNEHYKYIYMLQKGKN